MLPISADPSLSATTGGEYRGVLSLRHLTILYLLLMAPTTVTPLRCFAGDPTYQVTRHRGELGGLLKFSAFQHECTSLSYCLLIISRQGRSQWSCDGNSFNQVSLCSQLGQSGEDEAGDTSTIFRSSKMAVFEQSARDSNAGGAEAAESDQRGLMSIFAGGSEGSQRGGREDEEEALADFHRRQEELLRRRAEEGNEGEADRHRRRYSGTRDQDFAQQRQYHTRRHYAPIGYESPPPSSHQPSPAAVRYYNGQLKCFDGGVLGRICCCSTDFCNSAAGTRAVFTMQQVLFSIIAISMSWLVYTACG